MKLVLTDNLKAGLRIAQDIRMPGSLVAPQLCWGTALSSSMIREIKRFGIRYAYIYDIDVYAHGVPYLGDNPYAVQLPAIERPPPIITPEQRETAVIALKNLFEGTNGDYDVIHESAKAVRALDEVVDGLVDALSQDQDLLVNINDIKSYDDYTYHHSLSVAVLAIAIGQQLGYRRERLRALGMCGMLHDIGKIKVPIEIIHKPSRLDDRELATVKQHASAGYSYLLVSKIVDEQVLRGVLHHHERFDGSGYPFHLRGKSIPEFSRILSVADVYDALTSDRPYRYPLQPAEAMEYLMGSAIRYFDHDILLAFLARLEPYPVGSRLLLSTNTLATVLSTENQFRPIVRLDNGEILDLCRDRSCHNIVVQSLVSGY